MKVVLSSLAQAELEDARGYYNLQQEALGERFKEHIGESIDMIARFPLLYPKVTDTESWYANSLIASTMRYLMMW